MAIQREGCASHCNEEEPKSWAENKWIHQQLSPWAKISRRVGLHSEVSQCSRLPAAPLAFGISKPIVGTGQDGT